MEEDFFVRTADALVPVEVKPRNGNAKTLKNLIERDNYPDIHYGIKMVDGNIGVQNNIRTFPHYLTFLLRDYLRGNP